MIPDTINAGFESVAGLMALLHCRALFRSKRIEGVSPTAVVFFTLWGFWNMWYYPHLGQWNSFYGGLLVVSANVLYVAMIVYYKRFYPRCDYAFVVWPDGALTDMLKPYCLECGSNEVKLP